MEKITYITVQAPYGREETFIIDEMLAIKEAGADLLIIPRNPTKEVFHREVRHLLPNAIWLPLINFKMIHTFFISLIAKPCLLKILLFVIYNSRTLKILIKNLIVIPKGVFIANLLQRKKVNHIHTHWGSTTATMAYTVSCFSNIPWSFTLHRWDIREDNMLKEKVKSAKFIRCISEHGKNELVEIIGKEYQEKIKVIHMGVKIPEDTSEFEKKDITPKFTIVLPGHLIEVKGHNYLIQACSLLVKQSIENFQCIFLGEGVLRNELENLIKVKKLTDYIKMPGVIPHNELIRMYKNKKVDLVVLPSVNINDEREGIPVSLIEAMVYNIPVISTNTGGISELLSGGAGVIVEEKSSKKLAEAIRSLLKSSNLQRRLGEIGRNKVWDEFNVQKIVQTLLKLMTREK